MQLYDVSFAVDAGENLKEAILKRVTEYEIYSFYLGHAFQIGIPFSSPFRKDPNPSFGVFQSKYYNGLLHKDQGDARYVGNCFSFVSQLYNNISYKEALQLVQRDMYLGKLRRYLSYSERKPTEKTTKLSKLIQFEPNSNFTNFERKYWDDIGLTKEWLKFFNIHKTNRLFINGVETWTSTTSNPIFIYKIFDKMKCYRPFEKNKSWKWLSNTSRYDIQGWEQLPENNDEETLIITKSLKDVAVLRTLGYLAIAPPAESVLIPPAAMKLLRDQYNIKKFILLYDRDHGGMVGARKMFIKYRGEYNISFKFLDKSIPKDISDFYRKFGKKSTLRYLLYLLHHGPNEKLTVF